MIEHLKLSPYHEYVFAIACFFGIRESNAYFSQMSIIKSKKANKMHRDTLAHRFLPDHLVAHHEMPYHPWKPGKALVKDRLQIRYHQRHLEKKLSISQYFKQ